MQLARFPQVSCKHKGRIRQLGDQTHCCLKWKSESESRSVVCDSLWPRGLYSPWNSPGQNTEVGSLSLLQGIFPTQGSNPGPPHCRQILYQLSHKGRPRIQEWVAYRFFTGFSWPRNGTVVSGIAGGFVAVSSSVYFGSETWVFKMYQGFTITGAKFLYSAPLYINRIQKDASAWS